MLDPESGREYFIRSTNEPLGPGVSSPLGEDQRDWVWWELRREVLSGETLVSLGSIQCGRQDAETTRTTAHGADPAGSG